MEFLVIPKDSGVDPLCFIDICKIDTDICNSNNECNHVDYCPKDSGYEPCSTYDCGGYEYSLKPTDF